MIRGRYCGMNIVGHRGASVAFPENTPAAFAGADSMAADGVELDVRHAPDGRGHDRLVVFHNPLPDDQALLDDMPSLDEVFDACGDRMLINVEIKNSAGDGGFDPTMALVAPTVDAMRRRNWGDRWLISSFSIETINHCRIVAPEIPTAFLVEAATDAAIERAVAGGHRAIHPWNERLDAERVEACHRAGLVVNTWTCNDPDRLRELESFGVDGVCTDVPDVARNALGRDATPNDAPTWWPAD